MKLNLIIILLNVFFFTLFKILPFLIGLAFLTVGERKLLGSIQRREGPTTVGWLGLLQPLADGLKLFVKGLTVPLKSNSTLFIVAPIVMFGCTLVILSIIPFSNELSYFHLRYSLLWYLIISGISVYGLVFSGWASNSRYAFMGSIRALAQMISYELVFGVCVFTITLFGNFDLFSYCTMQKNVLFVWTFFPLSVIFFIMSLAESNRTPFDLTEAEAELVAGYNTEYSGIAFALFFLAEYGNIILLGVLFSILFLGSGNSLWPINLFFDFSFSFWLTLKTALYSILVVLIRGFLPRYRYDQLIFIGWNILLPLSFALFCFYALAYLNFVLMPTFSNELKYYPWNFFSSHK